ncbi:5-(carboxyamino)imidazole ribonucleotide synthase [Synechocystis sp. PCC 7509]|uniref:5-(carboxyamino)imidazole ribonucleotide synthase n=1 Tax=Synechocystis sp. PCC 7509 TaxID=927677 RepID=UPI0002ACFC72|nr:5-(carboxyamino)imidazole ribonucleotide synthase [Synechocystis sp. PCC 7509]
MSIKRVGVIGGGQLAWMMATAAEKLDIELVVQTPHHDDPAVAIASETIFAPVDDATATATLATRCNVVTFENEFVDLKALAPLADRGVCFRPSLQVLSPLLDKYHQRCYLQQIGLPVPKFATLEDAAPYQFPLVLKSRRHGYDGQGTFIVSDADTLQQIVASASIDTFLVEEFVPFVEELAIIAARSPNGEIVTYPVVETQQKNQVCHRVIAPAEISTEVATQIQEIAHKLLNSLQAVGIFGIELFLLSDRQVLVNEIAPRTHNSGHFTLDACECSQFEQHLRAVCDLPLGNAALRAPAAVMVNLLGYEDAENDYLVKRQQLAALPNAYVYWYDKKTSRLGRKLGHVTVLLDSTKAVEKVAQQVESIWYAQL